MNFSTTPPFTLKSRLKSNFEFSAARHPNHRNDPYLNPRRDAGLVIIADIATDPARPASHVVTKARRKVGIKDENPVEKMMTRGLVVGVIKNRDLGQLQRSLQNERNIAVGVIRSERATIKPPHLTVHVAIAAEVRAPNIVTMNQVPVKLMELTPR